MSNFWFKFISLFLINSFLLLDIAWAGGAELSVINSQEMLSVPIQISQQDFVFGFDELYDQKDDTSIELDIPANFKSEGLDKKKGYDNSFSRGLKSILIPVFIITSVLALSSSYGWAGQESFKHMIWRFKFFYLRNFTYWMQDHYIATTLYIAAGVFSLIRLYVKSANSQGILRKLGWGFRVVLETVGYALLINASVYLHELVYGTPFFFALFAWLIIKPILDIDHSNMDNTATDENAGGTQWDSNMIVVDFTKEKGNTSAQTTDLESESIKYETKDSLEDQFKPTNTTIEVEDDLANISLVLDGSEIKGPITFDNMVGRELIVQAI